MSKLSKLLQVTKEEKRAILQYFNIDEKEFEENVLRLKEWVSQCEHLPDETNDNKYKVCLLNSKMSMEKAKQMIEGYYAIRAVYSEDFFNKLLPNTAEYVLAKRYVKTVPMPKLTPDLCRITIYKLSDPDGEATDAYLYEMIVLMMAELRSMNDLFMSNIIIIDFDGYGWKNLLKFTPAFNQKMFNIMTAIRLRIKAIHCINVPNFIDQIMKLVKTFLPSRLHHKIHIHQTTESLREHIPLEHLPSNYGGTERSLEELYDDWCEQIEESEETFKKLLELKSSEKIELDSYQQNFLGLGIEGSFKKLTVD